MISTAKKPLNSLRHLLTEVRLSCWDSIARNRAERSLPFLKASDRALERIATEIGPRHREYVTDVSSEDMAVSRSTAALLLHLCRSLRPGNILDLGSGFSSYIFRSYAAEQKGVTVTSVDDDSAWLELTRRYLTENALTTEGLVLWHDFQHRPVERYDLIFHDLGRMPVRMQTLPRVLHLADAGDSLLVVDDVHKDSYKACLTRELSNYRSRTYDLSYLTRDQYRRSVMLIDGLRHRPATNRPAATRAG